MRCIAFGRTRRALIGFTWDENSEKIEKDDIEEIVRKGPSQARMKAEHKALTEHCNYCGVQKPGNTIAPWRISNKKLKDLMKERVW